MSKIYISFPSASPSQYLKDGERTSWNQITHFVYNHVYNKFPKITSYHCWNQEIPQKEEDILISCVPNGRLQVFPHRTIIVDNDNFDVDKWKIGKFTKYGMNATTTHSFPFNGCLQGLYGAVFKTNDVAIKKWNENNPEVFEKKQWLIDNIKNVEIVQHPMDKDYFSSFYNPNLTFPKLKMLVYNGPGFKVATQLMKLMQENIPTSSYNVINGMRKTESNVRAVLSEYAYFAQPSYSEGFPYFANEFLCQGLPLYGNEEWWEPYGYDILKYTYDPARHEENISNIKKLLSDDFKDQYYHMRKNLVQTHLDRKDNNWEVLTGKVIRMIEELL